MIEKIPSGRIFENRGVRVVDDPAITPERSNRAVQTCSDSGTKNIEWRTIKHCLTGITQFGTPVFPDRVFRMASRYDERAASGTQDANDVSE